MSLNDWLKNKWISAHRTSADEIQDLLQSAEEDLRNAGIPDLSPGWRLSIAYTASLRYARAALYASGYRPGREREHERIIDSLRLTMESVGIENIKLLHKIRKMRHSATYDILDGISDSEAEAAIVVAVELRRIAIAWLEKNYPSLINEIRGDN